MGDNCVARSSEGDGHGGYRQPTTTPCISMNYFYGLRLIGDIFSSQPEQGRSDCDRQQDNGHNLLGPKITRHENNRSKGDPCTQLVRHAELSAVITQLLNVHVI